jgi:hypothetical protein
MVKADKRANRRGDVKQLWSSNEEAIGAKTAFPCLPLPHGHRIGKDCLLCRNSTNACHFFLLVCAVGTLAEWERGEREPAGKFADSVKRFLDAAKTDTGARGGAG